MPRSKIVVGIATYSQGSTLKSSEYTHVGSATKGPSRPLPFTETKGHGAYYEICEMLAGGAKRVFDEEQKVPYLIKGDQWFSYDDEESIAIKMDYVIEQQLAGAFVWRLTFDDFNGKCPLGNGRKFPLINVIRDKLTAKDNCISFDSIIVQLEF